MSKYENLYNLDLTDEQLNTILSEINNKIEYLIKQKDIFTKKLSEKKAMIGTIKFILKDDRQILDIYEPKITIQNDIKYVEIDISKIPKKDISVHNNTIFVSIKTLRNHIFKEMLQLSNTGNDELYKIINVGSCN
uniref:Uncharacterized protein n=1 Tax=viral metagenome TaxID=1070528 RepID=A0A6C0E9G9_9ZZZZ